MDLGKVSVSVAQRVASSDSVSFFVGLRAQRLLVVSGHEGCQFFAVDQATGACGDVG